MARIKLQTTLTIQEAFRDFIISRKSKGLTDKTLESYQFHFRSIAKHLDITLEMGALQKADLDDMIASMRDAELSANSIQSYRENACAGNRGRSMRHFLRKAKSP